MSKLRITLTASFLLVLMGCNEAKIPATQEPSSPSTSTNTPQAANPLPSQSPIATPIPTASSPAASNPGEVSPTSSPIASKQLSPPTSAALTISPNGIGSARVGMKLGQLKQLLGGQAEFQVRSPFIVDFDAIAVRQSGKDQYYILYPAGVPLTDSDLIEALVTDNPNYRTAEGVGPGTPLQQAEAVYGDATLSYNTVNESREYVKFANQSSKAIAFRAKAPQSQQFAGLYPSSKMELKETKEFQKTAVIGFVEVYCGKNCPLPSP